MKIGVDEKINEEKEGSFQKKILKQFKKFQSVYTLDVEKQVDWGFDFYKHGQISYKDAEDISDDRDKIINNRSFIIGIEYAGNKILIPGDIETEGWEKVFNSACIRDDILPGTNFFVTSHHGRQSGCNSDILDYTGIPYIYIVSARAGMTAPIIAFIPSLRILSGSLFTVTESHPGLCPRKSANIPSRLLLMNMAEGESYPS